MIKDIINFIKCKFNGHKLISAGACPFTGFAYDICENCNMTIKKINTSSQVG
jgi:hypothetical protein